jgi:NodT family efflux transporter outer membrane factor (OMF) lipoprotein
VYKHISHIASIATCVAAASLLTGCIAVGPDFLDPAAPPIERYTKEKLATRTASTDVPTGAAQRFVQGRDLPQQWWRLFRSRGLNSLVERALRNNPNLQSTMSTLRASKEAVYAQEGKYFPLVEGNFNPTRQRTAASISPIPSNGATVFSLYTAQVLVSYTFDVWGLNRRTVESLQATADNQRFQVEAAYLTLTSNLAVAVITDASLRGQIAATMEIIRLNREMLGTLRRQFETGYASRNDVALQEAALAQVEATLPPLRKQLQQNRNLLTALIGNYAGQEEPRETFKLDDFSLPVDLPLSVPSKLIEQRPDVRQAQETLHSASAEIGVATANMLPSFTIDSNAAGYASTTLATLLSGGNAFWFLAGNVTQTVFDAGSLLHTLRGSYATFDAAAWTYKDTVVTAVQNVADAIRAIQNDADALKAARDFERAAKISFDLARQQVEAGNANILFVLTAQQTYLNALNQVVVARAARLSDTAALFQALGGGWWNRVEPPTERILNVGTGQAATLVDGPTLMDIYGLY